MQPGARLEPLDFKRITHGEKIHLVPLLERVRTLLRKPRLSEMEQQSLMESATRLISFAYSYMTHPPGGPFPSQLANSLARRFLVVYCLWEICEIIGEPMNRRQWWDRLMQLVVKAPTRWKKEPDPACPGSHYEQLVARLWKALVGYKNGNPPSPKDVVEVMRLIFNNRWGPPPFREPVWDSWRRDDREAQDSE